MKNNAFKIFSLILLFSFTLTPESNAWIVKLGKNFCASGGTDDGFCGGQQTAIFTGVSNSDVQLMINGKPVSDNVILEKNGKGSYLISYRNGAKSKKKMSFRKQVVMEKNISFRSKKTNKKAKLKNVLKRQSMSASVK